MKFALTAAGALLVVAGAANADAITYRFTGEANGSLGNATFTDAFFEILVTGDDADIFSPAPGLIRFETMSATVSIEGVANDVLINPTISVVSNQNSDVLVLGRVDTDRALIVYNEPEFEDYDLSAPFGPVTDETPGATAQFRDLPTVAGALDLSDMEFAVFEAIPAPGAMGLLALGGLVATRRRR